MPALESELDQLRARLARLENSTRPRGRCNMVRAAAYIGVSEETLRNMHKRKEGPPRKRIGTRYWSYAYDDLDDWLTAQADEQSP